MEEPPIDTGGPPPEEAQNRTFIILALVLGGVFVLGLLFLGLYAFFIGPAQRVAALNRAATANAVNTQIAINGLLSSTPNTPTPDTTGTALAIAQALTPATPVVAATVTNTAPPTATGLVTTPSSPTPGRGTRTPTPLVGGLGTTTPRAMPATGFADDAGVPGLILLGVVLIAVVVVARRLRLNLR